MADVPDKDLPKCSRCGRPRRPWTLPRGDKCSPEDWKICIRQVPEEDR